MPESPKSLYFSVFPRERETHIGSQESEFRNSWLYLHCRSLVLFSPAVPICGFRCLKHFFRPLYMVYLRNGSLIISLWSRFSLQIHVGFYKISVHNLKRATLSPSLLKKSAYHHFWHMKYIIHPTWIRRRYCVIIYVYHFGHTSFCPIYVRSLLYTPKPKPFTPKSLLFTPISQILMLKYLFLASTVTIMYMGGGIDCKKRE